MDLGQEEEDIGRTDLFEGEGNLYGQIKNILLSQGSRPHSTETGHYL